MFQHHDRGGHRVAILAAAVLPGALLIPGSFVPSAVAAVPSGEAADATGSPCRLVRLIEPPRGANGGVGDIERVGDHVVYYGYTNTTGPDGSTHRRALVWHGLRGKPVRVGPRGYDDDIALELTRTGLVNGGSLDRETGVVRLWVQDLRTMRLRFWDVDSGPRGADHGRAGIRRINARGAATGQVARTTAGPFPADAVGFASPTADLTLLSGAARALDSGAFGINDAGARAGYLATEFAPGHPDYLMWDPTRWGPRGRRVELVTPHGLDGFVRNIKNDGTAAGSIVWGDDPATAHAEAAYWPTARRNIGLGVLPGGSFSDAYGLDEGGWISGSSTHFFEPGSNPLAVDDAVDYAFLRLSLIHI